MLRSQQVLFISLFAVFSLPALGAEEVVAELESPRSVDASAELESGGKWQSASQGGISHDLVAGLGWAAAPGWRLGLDSEALLTGSASDPGGFLDTELSLARNGITLGEAGELTATWLTILPTNRPERDAGLQLGQGAVLKLTRELSGTVTLEGQVKGSRLFRDAFRAGTWVDTADGGRAQQAASYDQFRLEEKVLAGWRPLRGLGFEASAKHKSAWKWFGGREDCLVTEQSVSYELDAGWSLGLGHRNEARLLAQDGTRARVAFYRPDESTLFGTLGWEM